MITVEELLTYVGSNDTDYATTCLDEASRLVNAFIGSSTVPPEIADRAVLETGSELFHRKNAPSGIQQFSTTDGVPVRLNRDPMTQSYALLARWCVLM